MIEVIGVKFKSGGKMYYFAPGDLNPAEGSYVVVETARGPECGEVAARRHAVQDESITAPLKPILRLATAEDMAILEKNRAYMADAMRICQERIDARGLPMRLVDVECGFDSNKLIFYFTAESRVDFRELVKDLALAFHVRIELRQIGDRDEAKLLGGLGICGREFCCKGYLNSFQPISIKMAKEQGLALNPTKISGACGRLMCCLRYESPVYEELIKLTPKVGSTVILPAEITGTVPVRAYVMEANLVTGNLRVKPENSDVPVTVSRDKVERLQDASRRMTKDDLRDKRNQPEKADAPQKKEAPQQKQEKPEKPKAERPQRQKPQPKPAEEKPQVQAHPAAEKPQTEKPAAHAAAVLHPEFGENRQPKAVSVPQPKPAPRTAPLPDDLMDFTEHRALAEHPERAAEHPKQTPQKQGEQNRRFRRPNNNNRRNPNHRGHNPHRPQGDGKPQGGGHTEA